MRGLDPCTSALVSYVYRTLGGKTYEKDGGVGVIVTSSVCTSAELQRTMYFRVVGEAICEYPSLSRHQAKMLTSNM